MTTDKIILEMAKTIWLAEHPRKAWLEYPNYAQATVQQRYFATARVCFNMAAEHLLCSKKKKEEQT